jgi:hypothetical protein
MAIDDPKEKIADQPQIEFPLVFIHLLWASEANTALVGAGVSAPCVFTN